MPGLTNHRQQALRLGRSLAAVLAIALTHLPTVAAGSAANAGEFDKAARALFDGQVIPASSAQALQSIEWLRSLLPPNDLARQVIYQRLNCAYGFIEAPDKGAAYAQARLNEAHQRGDKIAEADFYYCLSGYHFKSLNQASAMKDAEAGLVVGQASGDTRILADGLANRGALRSMTGEHGKGLADLLEAQKKYLQLGLTILADQNLLNIAVAYRRIGQLDKAEEYLQKSAESARQQGDISSEVSAALQMGYLDQDRKLAQQAVTTFSQAVELAQKSEDPATLASANLALASAQLDIGQLAKAEKTLKLAEQGFVVANDHSSDSMIFFVRAQILAAHKQHTQAIALYNQAESAFKQEGNLRYQAQVYEPRALSYEAIGNKAAALADERAYIATHQQLEDQTQRQQTDLLRYQFDTARRDAENQQLAAEQAHNRSEIAALLQVKQWQRAALMLGSLLTLLLIYLATRQILRARRLHMLAMTDALTRVANRRRVELFGDEAIQHAYRDKKPLSILTFDIDFFKRINDNHGHAGGDQVLVRVAVATQNCLRQIDLLGRTGGEEFLVILPSATLDQAAVVAERLRASVQALTLSDIAPGLTVTISIGVAELKPEDHSLKELVRRADNALYRAKANGRNCTELDR